jgi:hypothetical protein
VTFVVTQEVRDGPPRRGANAPAPESGVYLRWAEIEEMVASEVLDVQSHSHAHVRWHAVHTDTAEHLRVLEADLSTSRRLPTERFGGTALNHLAWPWRESTASTRALARRLRFVFQYTVRNDLNTRTTPLDQINRLCVGGASLAAFAARRAFFRSSLLKCVYPPLRRRYTWMRDLVVKRRRSREAVESSTEGGDVRVRAVAPNPRDLGGEVRWP